MCVWLPYEEDLRVFSFFRDKEKDEKVPLKTHGLKRGMLLNEWF